MENFEIITWENHQVDVTISNSVVYLIPWIFIRILHTTQYTLHTTHVFITNFVHIVASRWNWDKYTTFITVEKKNCFSCYNCFSSLFSYIFHFFIFFYWSLCAFLYSISAQTDQIVRLVFQFFISFLVFFLIFSLFFCSRFSRHLELFD